MSDGTMFEWLAAHSESFQLRCNAHRDSHTTVARHLLHRERLGEAAQFGSARARATCVESGTLWELSVRQRDGSDMHLAGPTPDACLTLARSVLMPAIHHSIAA